MICSTAFCVNGCWVAMFHVWCGVWWCVLPRTGRRQYVVGSYKSVQGVVQLNIVHVTRLLENPASRVPMAAAFSGSPRGGYVVRVKWRVFYTWSVPISYCFPQSVILWCTSFGIIDSRKVLVFDVWCAVCGGVLHLHFLIGRSIIMCFTRSFFSRKRQVY